jgi:hypothetical protein
VGRRIAGWGIAVAGLVAAMVSLALPWAHYTVSADVQQTGGALSGGGGAPVYLLPGGVWCMLALLVAAGLVAVAALAEPRQRPAVGAVAALYGPLATLLPLRMANRIGGSSRTVIAQGLASVTADARPAAGLWLGVVALLLLAAGAAVLARAGGVARRAPAVPAA